MDKEKDKVLLDQLIRKIAVLLSFFSNTSTLLCISDMNLFENFIQIKSIGDNFF